MHTYMHTYINVVSHLLPLFPLFYRLGIQMWRQRAGSANVLAGGRATTFFDSLINSQVLGKDEVQGSSGNPSDKNF